MNKEFRDIWLGSGNFFASKIFPPPPPSPDLNSDWSLLLNRRTATWNLFVKENQHITKQVAVEISVNKT